MDEEKFNIWMTILIILGILLLIGTIIFGTHVNKIKEYENFQKTIRDLSDEQKCIHICGFRFSNGYLENYKFCMEKCDRISERIKGCE